MSIHWNHFKIDVKNKTGRAWSLNPPKLTRGSPQTALSIRSDNDDEWHIVFIGQSSSDSTSGTAGTLSWTSHDNVVLTAEYVAPNRGAPSATVTLTGLNLVNYKITPDGTANHLPCSGTGCPINSGYRKWELDILLEPA